MSTRSAIIEKRSDGTYRGIYCHFDGYPEHHAPILTEHYADPAKVSRLIDLGDISVLRPHVDPLPSGSHTFNRPQPDVVVAYRRDRGEKDCEPVSGTLEHVSSNIGHNGHVYVFADGTWTHNGEPLSAPSTTFDDGCLELASEFLVDSSAGEKEAARLAPFLAAEIQKTIEGFMAEHELS